MSKNRIRKSDRVNQPQEMLAKFSSRHRNLYLLCIMICFKLLVKMYKQHLTSCCTLEFKVYFFPFHQIFRSYPLTLTWCHIFATHNSKLPLEGNQNTCYRELHKIILYSTQKATSYVEIFVSGMCIPHVEGGSLRYHHKNENSG